MLKLVAGVEGKVFTVADMITAKVDPPP